MSFYSRALFSTLNQLKKLSIITPKENNNNMMMEQIHTLFHLKQYYAIFEFFSCHNLKVSDAYYLCNCCNNYNNFMRNYSLFLHLNLIDSETKESHISGLKPINNTNDPFIYYICALTNSGKKTKEKYLLLTLKYHKLFYEALELLMPILTDKVSLFAIYNEHTNTPAEQLVWEFFKMKYFIEFYIDLGIENNKIIKVIDKNEKPLKRKSFMEYTRNVDLKISNLQNNEKFPNINKIDYSSINEDLTANDSNMFNEIQNIKKMNPDFQIDVIDIISNINFDLLITKENEIKINNFDENEENIYSNTLFDSKSNCEKIQNMKSGNSNTFVVCTEMTESYLNNLKAAYFYTVKQYEKSISLFRKSKTIDFLDYLSHILYIMCDLKGLSILAFFLLNINPFGIEGLISMGNYHSLCKNREKAIQYFKKALKYHTLLGFINNLIGQEYLDSENLTNALEYFKKCQDYRALFGMGQCYLKLNIYNLSIEMFKRSLQLYEKNTFAWHFLGDAYRKINEYKNAIKCFSEMVKLGDPHGLLLTGEVYKERRDYERAVKYFEKYSQFVDDNRIKAFLEEYYIRVAKK